jgi:hypothetical protein
MTSLMHHSGNDSDCHDLEWLARLRLDRQQRACGGPPSHRRYRRCYGSLSVPAHPAYRGQRMPLGL